MTNTVRYRCPFCDKVNHANTSQINCECGKVYWTDRLDDDGQPPRIVYGTNNPNWRTHDNSPRK